MEEQKPKDLMKIRKKSKDDDDQSHDYLDRQKEIIPNKTHDDEIDLDKKPPEMASRVRKPVREGGGLQKISLEYHIKRLNESNRSLDIELNRLLEEKERLQNTSLAHQKTLEEQENHIKRLNESNRSLDIELNRLLEEKERLQNTSLAHQKTLEEQENHIKRLNESNRSLDIELNRLLEEKERLQNTSLAHQKTLEEQENHIKRLNESNRSLDIELKALDKTLYSIQQSITWRLLTPLKRTSDRFSRKPDRQPKLDVPIDTESSAPPISSANTSAGGVDTVQPVKPRTGYKKDILCFPLIDWNFRYQRTQHLLAKFAESGHRIFHLTVNLSPQKRAYSIINLTNNIFEVSVSSSNHFNVYKDTLNKQSIKSTFSSVEQMQRDLNIDAISFVAFPTWAPLVFALKREYGWPIIYDCMDDYYEFGNVNRERIEEEIKLFRESDIVITTSAYLYKKAKKISDKTLCIPNAGEFDRFKNLLPNDLLNDIKSPIVGYYGAIAEWFDNETIEFIAQKRTNISFVFIGHTFGSNIARLEKLSNVHFLGEKPYSSLPLYLYHFNVCLIPFKSTSLIEATHPVKFYEYLASGKPVVSTKITELIPFGNLCYLSSSKEEFLMNLDRAINENNPYLVKRRIEFASKNTWRDRFDFLYSEVNKLPASKK